jgi:zinc finger BED domain-containing protein 1 (E3 SUMO-protein ligase ZBED1)
MPDGTTYQCCKHCKVKYVDKGSTSNPNHHLRSAHPLLIDASRGRTQQLSIPQVLANSTPHTEEKMGDLHMAFLEFIVDDMQPFSLVTNVPFRSFVAKLDPRFSMPTERSLHGLLASRYQSLQHLLRQLIDRTMESATVTMDLWTSRASIPFLGITLHWLSDTFEQYDPALSIRNLPYPHTGTEIAAAIDSVFSEWALVGKIFVATADGGSNIVNAIGQTSGVEYLHCSAHLIQLTVRDGLDNIPDIKALVTKCRNLVTFFAAGHRQLQRLKAAQEYLNQTPPVTVVQDVATRWNSTFYMLQRLIRLREAIAVVGAELAKEGLGGQSSSSQAEAKSAATKLNKLALTSDEWEMVEETIRILAPFEAATRMLSGSKYTTLSLVYPTIAILKENLEKTAPDHHLTISLKARLSSSLASRWKSPGTLGLWASLLDPRFKLLQFVTNEDRQEAVETLRREFDALDGNVELSALALSNEESVMANFFSSLQGSEADRNVDEFDLYMALPPIRANENNDPVEWWRRNRGTYPVMARLARKYLAVKATSVPSEQLFSAAGNLITEKRSRLSDSIVSQLLFVHSVGRMQRASSYSSSI